MNDLTNQSPGATPLEDVSGLLQPQITTHEQPAADGFRDYLKARYSVPAEALLVDKAQLLTLSAPELTVLIGGMRALNANWDGSAHGVLTDRPGTLSNIWRLTSPGKWVRMIAAAVGNSR